MIHLDTQHPALRSSDSDLAETLLLTTKLALPVVQPGTIVRQRLIERLNQGIQRRVTLVAAPAGFGKTSLLSAWAQQVQAPVGWVALDEGDNDPVRFWSYVITALDGAHPGVGASSLAVLRSPQAGSIERALTLVVNALATLSEPITLVLDDCHVITSLIVYQTLTFVIDHLPPQLHLVLASRINPPLPLARLRVRGELAEIRTEQLRFTVDEATALLRETLAVNIAAVDIDTLIVRTEGWAAGLHLAGLSLQSQPDSTRFVASLRGSDRFILDYLVDEVLAQQPPTVQHFLLHTAILERLSAELCDAVVGLSSTESYLQGDGQSGSHTPLVTGRSQQMLEYLEQANLFTTPLDREGYWYRYHQLFAEFLRARLQRTQPELVPELHRRAANWYEQAGQPADAVSHALAIGDHPWAARLIENAADSLLQRAELATLMTWFGALPTAAVRARPRLCLIYALALVTTSSFEIVEDWLASAEAGLEADRAAEATTLAPDEMRHELNGVRAIVAILQGDITQGMTLARTVLVRLPFQNPFRQSLIAFLLALGYMWNDQIAAEDRALIATAVSGPLTDGPLVSLRGTYSLAHLWSVHGRLRDAAALYRQALPPNLELGQSLPPVASMLYAGLATILWEQNDLAEARRCALASIELGKAWPRKRMILDSLLVLSRVQQAEGDSQGASATMAQAEQHANQSSIFPWITSLIAAARARLDLLQGNTDAAARWAQSYEERAAESSPGAQVPVFRRAVADLILARVHLAQGRIDAARQVFATVLPMAEANQWRGVVIETLALGALAASTAGNDAGAQATLTEALANAEPEGYMRVFIDEGPPMGRLLARIAVNLRTGRLVPPNPPTIAYVELLLAAMPTPLGDAPQRSAPALSAPVPQSPLIEPLSEREHEVLHLLAEGMSNQDVARTLVISVATVKTHIINIYSKLGVHSRTQAVARARELRLV